MFKNFNNNKNIKIVEHFNIFIKDATIINVFKNNIKKLMNSISIELFSNFYTSDIVSKHAKIMNACANVEDF